VTTFIQARYEGFANRIDNRRQLTDSIRPEIICLTAATWTAVPQTLIMNRTGQLSVARDMHIGVKNDLTRRIIFTMTGEDNVCVGFRRLDSVAFQAS
jgi:hypothetical protein